MTVQKENKGLAQSLKNAWNALWGIETKEDEKIAKKAAVDKKVAAKKAAAKTKKPTKKKPAKKAKKTKKAKKAKN